MLKHCQLVVNFYIDETLELNKSPKASVVEAPAQSIAQAKPVEPKGPKPLTGKAKLEAMFEAHKKAKGQK